MKRILLLALTVMVLGCGDNTPSQRINNTKHNEATAVSDTVILDKDVTGTVRGKPFNIEQAIIEGGTLTLRQGSDFFADTSVDIVMFGETNLENKKIVIPSANSNTPHLRLNIKSPNQSLPNSLTVLSDYLLVLIFGKKTQLGIPFKVKLLVKEHNTHIEGAFFATFADIKVNNQAIDVQNDSLDTLEHLAKAYIKENHPHKQLGEKFGLSYAEYGKTYPKHGFIGYEIIGDNSSPLKLQLIKSKAGWRVENELATEQLDQAHPVIKHVTGNIRTVEGYQAKIAAAKQFEQELKDKGLIAQTRATSVRCYLTKAADKASCRAVYGLLENGNTTCHNINYLLTRSDTKWQFSAHILDSQKVDYSTGELVEHKPFTMRCL